MTAAEIAAAVALAGLQPLPDGASERFAEYLALLLKWNARVNLTAVREPAEIVRRHFLESIQCAQSLPAVETLLDFGSGAGFPGIPIALSRPEIRVTLGESQAKKAAFLREAARVLNIEASVFDGRIETMDTARRYEAVTLRAVDKMGEACVEGFRRVEPGGWMVIFVTVSTEGAVREVLPVVEWSGRLPLLGMADGFLLTGRRVDR